MPLTVQPVVGRAPAQGTAPNSTAPMSQAAMVSPLPSTGRKKPRWSVAGQSVMKASIAGLPGTRLGVLVGPPLLAKVVFKIAPRALGVVLSEVAVKSKAPGVQPEKA